MGDQVTSLNNGSRGPLLVGQDIYEESSVAKCRVGTRLQIGDRVFRYCYNGAVALVPGKLVQGPAIDTYDEDIVVPTSSPIGSKTVYLTNHTSGRTVTVDMFKNGYFCIGSGAGSLGQMYKIKSNTAAATNALLTLTLYDALTKVVTASTHTGHLVQSPYNGVVIDAGTAMCVGVPLIAVTINYYFWAQTYGPAPVISAGAITKNEDLLANGDGTVIVDDAATAKPKIGNAMGTYDSGDAGPVFLCIMA